MAALSVCQLDHFRNSACMHALLDGVAAPGMLHTDASRTGCMHALEPKPVHGALAQVAMMDAPDPAAVAFSPRNTYLTIFQKPQQGAGNAEKNLKVGGRMSNSAGM